MNEKHVIAVLGEQVEVLVSSKSTHNSFFVGVQTSPPGGGPPPHVHEREDELFTVLEGEYELFDGQQWTPFCRGEYQSKLRGELHTFRNCGSTTGKMLIMATPGGLDEYFEFISPLTLPQDITRLIEISKMFGITFVTH